MATTLTLDPPLPGAAEPTTGKRRRRVARRRHLAERPCRARECRHAVGDHVPTAPSGTFCHVCLEVCGR